MSVAYCKNCLEMWPCGCPNEGEVIYGDTRREIAQIVKDLRANGFEEAAEYIDDNYL